MPKRTAYVLAFLLTLSLLARADEWRKNYSIAGLPEISADTNDGDIRVNASDRKDIQAVVTVTGEKIGPSGVQITEHQDGNRVSLKVHAPNRWGIVVHRRLVRVEIEVPRQADLDLHSGDGNIRILDVQGRLQVETGDGEVEARGTNGPLKAHTGDGNIRVQGLYTALDLHTGDGNIDAEVDPGSKMESSWALRTGDGNIDLRVPANFSAELDAHTGDGRLNFDFPLTVEGAMKESAVRGRMNQGGQTLELRSGDGNISLHKA